MPSVTYGIAPRGVFFSIQGEGHLVGAQMVFVRFAGCSVNCPGCDTDYSLERRVDLRALVKEVCDISPAGWRDRWVWLTGGEPLDRDLRPLIRALRSEGYSIALATSGTKRAIDPVDWLSVSPHRNKHWVQRFGDECKIIPGLNGARFEDFDFGSSDFLYYYAQPMTDSDGQPVNRQECLRWVKNNPNWLMTEQMHKVWGVE